jgi:hypothetical protein
MAESKEVPYWKKLMHESAEYTRKKAARIDRVAEKIAAAGIMQKLHTEPAAATNEWVKMVYMEYEAAEAAGRAFVQYVVSKLTYAQQAIVLYALVGLGCCALSAIGDIQSNLVAKLEKAMKERMVHDTQLAIALRDLQKEDRAVEAFGTIQANLTWRREGAEQVALLEQALGIIKTNLSLKTQCDIYSYIGGLARAENFPDYDRFWQKFSLSPSEKWSK